MDELRKSKRKLSAKEKKKQGAQYLFEIRCIEFLSTFCQKTGQESYMKSLVQIYKEVLTTCEDEYLHSIIILDLKEMKVNSKSTFKIVEKVYENGSVLEEVAGTFYQFCKATETEEFVTKPHLLGKDSKEEYKKKRNLEHERRLNILRVVRQGTEMPVGKYPSTKNEFAINSEIYSISDLKQKLQNSLPAIEPKNRWASLEKVHGDKFEEIQKQELIRFVSLVNRFNILSLRHTRPLSQHHKTHEIMKIDDVKDHIRETLTEYCAKTDFVEFIQPDIQVFMDYIQNDNSLRLDDALFFLAQCNEENIMIVEKFSHQTFSMKPVYTFLIDQDGFISRIQQLLFDHVVGLGTETPVEKEMRLQVAHDCIYLIQQMFLAMTRHSEVARIKYLLTETKLIESMIHCWMHAKDELMICEGFSQCFEDIIESSEIVPMNLVFKKQFLALLIDMLSVAKTLPDREEDKPDFTTLTRSVSSLLYRVSIPTEINAATGIFPKKQRKLLSAIEECTILDDLLAVMEQKKYLIEELFSWKLSQERKYYHDWIPSLATLFSNCSRQPSLREYFYKDNFKYSEFILKEIVFPLSDTLSGFGAKNLPAANTPVCYGFINYLSIINHLLFDPEQRERFFSDPVNRTSKKGQKLEDMCFYWMVEMLKLFKDSRTELTQAQQFIWGRTSFCVCSMVLHDSFRKYLVRDTNFVEMLMDFLKSRTSHLFKDIKNACCRILQAILRDEEVKNKLNVNALLKFIDSEMSFALESPFPTECHHN
ncbi:hypothetical protein C9374_000779 [Naegleria lovaniensis]|uniref:Uncharacterized protein n=1 Tax=Naegleria lovaniensis TaxID=51637 RepID=A0AA88GXJ3_NAELO|nr:uncharacterized protein C9374_000779 [Naegleria lovaniensis]KAG2387929.1 hypothetical protein C9374_000779 [Naegleria lovaniensis]